MKASLQSGLLMLLLLPGWLASSESLLCMSGRKHLAPGCFELAAKNDIGYDSPCPAKSLLTRTPDKVPLQKLRMFHYQAHEINMVSERVIVPDTRFASAHQHQMIIVEPYGSLENHLF